MAITQTDVDNIHKLEKYLRDAPRTLGKLMEAAMGLDALRNPGDDGRLEITIERINACGDTLAELIKKEISKGVSS